jgi:hypothetical protein
VKELGHTFELRWSRLNRWVDGDNWSEKDEQRIKQVLDYNREEFQKALKY